MKAVFFDVQDYEINFLRDNCPRDIECVFIQDALTSCAKTEGNILDADIISVFASSDVCQNNLEKFKNLKYILTRSVGFSHIDIEYAKSRNIKVFNTPHYGDWTVAEFTFGLLLNMVRRITKAEDAVKKANVKLDDFIGMELNSKTLGIIGLGAIGQRVAKIAKGFEMEVVAYDTHKIEGYKYVDFEKLLKISDIITIHCPLTFDTKHLISKKEFEIMKQGVVIINTARGEIIDTQALLNSIKCGKVAYAGLDVLECEDVTCKLNSKDFKDDCINESCFKKYMLNQKLIAHPNVIITPHIAYDTKEAIERILKLTVENLETCIKGDFIHGNKNIVL